MRWGSIGVSWRNADGFSFLEPDHPLRVTVSAGVATFASELDFTSAEQLVAAADRALYAAKKAGKNRVVVHEP